MRLMTAVLLSVLSCTWITKSTAEEASDWPQWRGRDRDAHSQSTGLLRQWPQDGPAVAWQVTTVGEAYSSIAVAGGRVYTLGNVDKEGRIICLDEKDGQVIWSVRPPTEQESYTHGRGNGARGMPTIDGRHLYAVGGSGDVTCLETDTGNVVWSSHLVTQLGGNVPGWGYSESPLVAGDLVIITPGGAKGCVAALNKLTGEVVWRSETVPDRAHYCSAILIESQGVQQIVTFTGGAGGRKANGVSPRVIGLDAASGALLWSYDKSANGTANVSSPVFQADAVFSASGYGTGGGLVKLARGESGFSAEEVYFERAMQNHHGGMVLVDGWLYGFGSGGLLCMKFDTGEIAWRNRSVGKGSLCYADGHLYCYGEKNEVALVEANPSEYVEKGRFAVPRGDWPTWAHPVVANGRFYLRDMKTLTAYGVLDH